MIRCEHVYTTCCVCNPHGNIGLEGAAYFHGNNVEAGEMGWVRIPGDRMVCLSCTSDAFHREAPAALKVLRLSEDYRARKLIEKFYKNVEHKIEHG